MTIACVRIPCFPATLVRRHAPRLAAQPLILWVPERQRLVVYAACGEAARAGVCLGLPLRRAQLYLPGAQALPAAPAHDRRVFGAILARLEAFTPQLHAGGLVPHAVAMLALDDLAPQTTAALGGALRAAVRAEAHLEAGVGLGPSQIVATVAARTAGAHRTVIVAPHEAAAFLAPRPVAWLPAARPLLLQLQQLGLTTVGAVAALPRDAVSARWGRAGLTLLRQCQGEDTDPPPAIRRPPRTFEARRRWPAGDADHALAADALPALARRLARQLDQDGSHARELTLAVEAGRSPAQMATRLLPHPTSDARGLIDAAHALFAALPCDEISSVTLTVGGLAPVEAEQLALFPAEHAPRDALLPLMRRLQSRYGPGRLLRARVSDAQARLWEQRVLFDDWEGE
jgi:nucleotidyltransferase/DNA polymerase involved in DNA repair